MKRHLFHASASLWVGLSLTAAAQTLDPYYAAYYQIHDLGSAPGVTTPYGGLTFTYNDTASLLLGGTANSMGARLYDLHVARDSDGHVASFGCSSAEDIGAVNGVAGGIDGGLCYGPSNVLFYTTFPDNVIGELRPGDTTPGLLTPLGPLGVAGSVGAIYFVPPSFAGAGRLKIASYNSGNWYDTTVTADPNGTYTINPVSATVINIGGGPEGFVYIKAGNPQFSSDSILVTEYATGRVVSYEIDTNGDPVVATRRVFITGLGGAEGAAVDPVTGDFLFSTFGGGSRVIEVRGFTGVISCVGDMNGDRIIDLSDLSRLLSSYGVDTGGDLNGDCVTDLADLSLLLSHYGNNCN